MELTEIDRLNITYFGEMSLPDREKALRVKIAAEFEKLARKYLLALQGIFASGKPKAQLDALVAAAAAAFAREYKSLFDNWYNRYYAEISSGASQSAVKAQQWRDKHSAELAVWLAETVRNTPAGSAMSRLLTDIRTEVNAMCNLAAFCALADSGAKVKKWRAHKDELTRATHARADGQTVPVDEPFIVGGYALMFPGDTSLGAPPQEIANCRCVMQRAKL